ncbi:hypothetical protein MHPYR_320053 [uncultured Mycobacterium sp.]|uniref:Uncharacterized protein n=1 Tax=uncultured Mycobacterium sp. TaxID=171292 RepID=A0A1Y5PCP2_9MYCO|nr:hypothetical protein MHPYR_300025 [uncultured Mycobacterium sp.]SBS76475.1 hypothetical protein MHPYR_320053 [uncultured Mycobacterium sp.]
MWRCGRLEMRSAPTQGLTGRPLIRLRRENFAFGSELPGLEAALSFGKFRPAPSVPMV